MIEIAKVCLFFVSFGPDVKMSSYNNIVMLCYIVRAVAGLRGGLRGHRPTLLLDLYWSHANICTYMYTRISNSILWSAFITEILVF